MALMLRRDMSHQQPKSVAIIGAGLAGAACASAFANRGYSVIVYEQSPTTASGASGVPIAMFAPSISSDDAPHSRLLRNGVNLLLEELRRLTNEGLLTEGADWAMTGVLERCIRGEKKLPTAWLEPQDPLGLASRVLGKPMPMWPAGDVPELFHPMAGWVNPKRLVAAWLSHPNNHLKTRERIDDLSQLQADVVVIACGYETCKLLPGLQGVLQPIRGQVEWGCGGDFDKLSLNGLVHPINGMGHFIQASHIWVAGATFQRDESDLTPRATDVELNFEKLERLLPELERPYLISLRDASQSWVGVRAAQKNRQPLIQRIENSQHPNTWVCAGLGSRGLSLAALCASRLLDGAQGSLALS